MIEEVSQLLNTGEYQQAIELLMQRYATEQNSIEVINLLGFVHFKVNLFNDATNWFAKSANLIESFGLDTSGDVTAATVYQNLAESAMQSGHLDIARSALLKLRTIDPENSFAKGKLDILALNKFLYSVLEAENDTNNFISFHTRPIRSGSYGLKSDSYPREKIAIVIQGPLATNNDFTLETVKLYRKIFPYCKMIVSTWVDQDGALIEKIRMAGAEILLNEKPDLSGFMNINMQLRSALNGITLAAQQGFSYVLKTRTDYRIYNPYFFIDALNLLSAFPLRFPTQDVQRQRLVAFGDTNRYIMYDVPDKNMFGYMDDMRNYWSPPEDTRSPPGELHTILELAQFGVAESYLLTRYMARIGRELKWSLTDYWNILKDHFVYMDQSAADMYWYKHERTREYRWKQYAFDSSISPFGFLDWLRLYQGKYPMLDDSRIILRNHGAFINDILSENLHNP